MSGRSRGALGAILFVAALVIGLGALVSFADSGAEGPGPAQEAARQATGGAQTLEDILARQRGEKVSNAYRRAQTGGQAAEESFRDQLGTLGAASDADVYRAIRFGEGDLSVSIHDPRAAVMIQDAGMDWLRWRAGPLREFGLWAPVGVIVLLALFYLVRGRVRIEHGRSGERIARFSGVERFGHWLLASSFLLLAVTGLALLFGRPYLIPLIGKDAFAEIAEGGKWIHNNVAWAFMLGLVLVFVMWVWNNIPDRTDLRWLAQGGGLFTKGVHPPAKKFNAGQKIVFWAVVVLGVSVSASGLSLLFPFQIPMFAKTFDILNHLGAGAVTGGPLPTDLQPHQEMQYAQLWHAIVAIAMIVIILAHIYLGTLGMEGAFDAMGTGEVDRNWAEEHHSLWVREVDAGRGSATPAD